MFHVHLGCSNRIWCNISCIGGFLWLAQEGIQYGVQFLVSEQVGRTTGTLLGCGCAFLSYFHFNISRLRQAAWLVPGSTRNKNSHSTNTLRKPIQQSDQPPPSFAFTNHGNYWLITVTKLLYAILCPALKVSFLQTPPWGHQKEIAPGIPDASNPLNGQRTASLQMLKQETVYNSDAHMMCSTTGSKPILLRCELHADP